MDQFIKSLLLLLILIQFYGPSMASEETLVFTFNPGDSRQFVQKLKTVKEKDIGELGKQVDEIAGDVHYTVKRMEEGWIINAEPVGLTIKRNGKVLDNQIMEMITNVSTTIHLDTSGHIVDIQGYEELLQQLSKIVQPAVYKKLTPLLNVESLKAKGMAEWRGRFDYFIDAKVSVGETFTDKIPHQLPDKSTIEYDLTTHFEKMVSCGQNRCIVIKQSYDSRADNLGRLANELVADIAKSTEVAVPGNTNEVPSTYVTGHVVRTIEPSTMLIHSENLQRVIRTSFDVPGKGRIPMMMKESRSYQYQY